MPSPLPPVRPSEDLHSHSERILYQVRDQVFGVFVDCSKNAFSGVAGEDATEVDTPGLELRVKEEQAIYHGMVVELPSPGESDEEMKVLLQRSLNVKMLDQQATRRAKAVELLSPEESIAQASIGRLIIIPLLELPSLEVGETLVVQLQCPDEV